MYRWSSPTYCQVGPAIAVWGDAACVVPWVLYERFGDAGILERQWDSMRSWVDYIAAPQRATTSSGVVSSSSGTGSTRPLRPTTPRRLKPTRT